MKKRVTCSLRTADCEVRVRLAVVVDNKRLRNDFKVQGSLAEREEKLALLHCVS